MNLTREELETIQRCIDFRYKKLTESTSKKIRPIDKAAELACLYELRRRVKRALGRCKK